MIYLLFSAMIVMMTATDSLEATFATRILSLSKGGYGILVSIAGAGVLVGSISNAIINENTYLTAYGYGFLNNCSRLYDFYIF